MAYADRVAAWQTLLAAQRTQKIAASAASASFTTVMSGVAVNTISAQNITDLNTAQTNWNAATAAYDAAIAAAGASMTRPDSGI
jgi:hypothetical protein